ncbi:MAG: carbohydrate porin [Thermonemataceae bacterium]
MPWYNLSGGLSQGFVYMDNLDAKAFLKVDHLLNWKHSLTFFGYLLGNNGGRATTLMGDFQVASKIEAPRAWRLYEYWVEYHHATKPVSLLVGTYDLNSEFDILSPAQLFINSSFGIGAEYAQSGRNGPSIFPVAALGIRSQVWLSDAFNIKMAILDGVPGDPKDLTSSVISLSASDGLLLALESTLYFKKPPFSTSKNRSSRLTALPNKEKLNLGVWYYTARFPTVADSTETEQGNFGIYAGYQQYFSENRLSTFMRIGGANPHFNQFSAAISGGMVYRSLFKRLDQLGIGFSTGLNNRILRRNGYKPHETVLELTATTTLLHFLIIQPNFQYVIHPAAAPSIANAAVVSLSITIAL